MNVLSKSKYRAEIDEFGFTIVPQIIGDTQTEKLVESLSKISTSSAGKNTAPGIRNLLNVSSEVGRLVENSRIKDLIENIIGNPVRPVRAIFFDKTLDANWKVPWHQDLTITVKEKRETDGFTAWTTKESIQHVQPPVSILEKMLAIRLHLDDTDEANGALKVIPKSHKKGRLCAAEIQNLKKTNKIKSCNVKRGSAFLMRPLLVHSSSSGTNPSRRRVIHIEFSAENLPNGLEWYGS